MRALRSAFTRRPMPGITKTPFFLVSLTAVSACRSRKAATCLLVSSSFSARSRIRAVLVNPVAMCCSPFWACPWARRCCLGFRSRGAFRMEGVQATRARNPCIHAGSENPVVRYNATFRGAKSRKKPRFPQISLVFVLFFSIFPVFAGICRF